MIETPRGATVTYHLSMNIKAALDTAYMINGNTRKDYDNLRAALNMDQTSQKQFIMALEEMRKQGYEAIPSESCDNHADGHCKGHIKRGIHARKVHV